VRQAPQDRVPRQGDRGRGYDVLDVDGWVEASGLRGLIRAFDEAHSHAYQIGFNGRSSGYLVLYQGGRKDSGLQSYPGRSLDMGEDFDDRREWDGVRLRGRVDLVWHFDQMVEAMAAAFVKYCASHRVVEEEVVVRKKVKRLRKVT
jgi:hypothetical protein